MVWFDPKFRGRKKKRCAEGWSRGYAGRGVTPLSWGEGEGVLGDGGRGSMESGATTVEWRIDICQKSADHLTHGFQS